MTLVPILMLLASCVAIATERRALAAGELAEVEGAALELVARASSRYVIGKERKDECFAVLSRAEGFLRDPGEELAARRTHARATAALTEVVYWDRSDEAVRLAILALDALGREPRDVVAASWTGQALRGAEQAGLRVDRELEDRLVRLASSVPLDAPTLELSAAHGLRGLLGDPGEDDVRMREVGAELLRRDFGDDFEAMWLASIGFCQHGGGDLERWYGRLKSCVASRERLRLPAGWERSRFPTRDHALFVLVLATYYRYVLAAGTR